MTLVNRFGRPMPPQGEEEKPELWLSPQALQAAQEEERRRHEQDIQEQIRQVSPEQEKQVVERFKVMAGQVLLRKRKVARVLESGLTAGTRDEIIASEEFDPWGTILAVGGKYQTDWGVMREPDEDWAPGRRVLFHPASRRDVDLPIPGTDEKMTVCLVGFMSIYMVDRGEEVIVAATEEGVTT